MPCTTLLGRDHFIANSYSEEHNSARALTTIVLRQRNNSMSSKKLGRREALGVMGAAGAALAFGCGGSPTSPDTATSTTTTTGSTNSAWR